GEDVLAVERDSMPVIPHEVMSQGHVEFCVDLQTEILQLCGDVEGLPKVNGRTVTLAHDPRPVAESGQNLAETPQITEGASARFRFREHLASTADLSKEEQLEI